jgi:hypothetical protein
MTFHETGRHEVTCKVSETLPAWFLAMVTNKLLNCVGTVLRKTPWIKLSIDIQLNPSMTKKILMTKF